jgi:hypothetical protein
MSEPVLIAPAIAEALTLDAWGRLSDAERLEAADHLTERLEAHGWSFAEMPALRAFGPPGEEQPVLQWRDGRSGLTFSLIPGGTFRPGYGPELLAEYDRLYRLLQASEFEAQEGGWTLLTEPPLEGFWDVRQKAAVTVGSFLMAAELVPRQAPGLAALLDPDVSRSYYYAADYDDPEGPPFLLTPTWDELPRVLSVFGWSLPTSQEFEWALRGGVEALFYWGNAVPRWFVEAEHIDPRPGPDDPRFTDEFTYAQLMDEEILPDRPRRWPWCNRFGLAAPLAAVTWCAARAGEGGETYLVTRGGAADTLWDGRGAWGLFLSAVEGREPAEPPRVGPTCHALRPVVRLQGSPAVPLK